MLKLLKSDLYSLAHTRMTWVFLVLLCVVILGGAAVSSALSTFVEENADVAASTEVSADSDADGAEGSVDPDAAGTTEGTSTYKSFSGFIELASSSGVTGGMATFLAVLFCALACARDLKGGYAKNLVGGRRRVYFAERLVCLGIVCAAFLLLAIALSAIGFIVLGGYTFTGMEAPLDIVVWLVLAWLQMFFYAALVALITFSLRSGTWGCVAAVLFGMGIVGGACSIGFAQLASVAHMDMLATVGQWLPNNNNVLLGQGASALWTADEGGAVMGSLHVLLSAGICAAAACIACVELNSRRDMA